MVAGWGSFVARFRWAVLASAIIAVVAAGIWGTGVFDRLSEGGYTDPGSESSRAAAVVRAQLGPQDGDVVVIYRPAQGSIDDPALGRRIQARLAALPKSSVAAVTGYWPGRTAQYAAADRRSAVAVLTLTGEDDGEKLDRFREIDDKLSVAGATVQLAGAAPLGDASAARSTDDLAFAEAVSLPVVLILLLFIFGSLVAASLPVLVGGCAVLGSLGVLNAIARSHDVNSFAVNVASLLGLGMAIDYGLFMVGRFREEQGFGRTPAQAVTRTVATAGRTVLFSATLLMIALAGLLLFPQGFLKSLAYGGLAAVALAALLSLTLLPALLAVLGHRVDKLPVRLPRRRSRAAGTGWAALADTVLRRPVLVALPILAGLLVLAAPIRGVQFGENDERVLPATEPARQAVETLKRDYPALSSAGIQVVLRGSLTDTRPFADEVKKVPGIAAVTPGGKGGDVVTYTATLADKDPFSAAARTAVDRIRDLRPPTGSQLLVGGTTARNVDSLAATADRLPLMVALLIGATLLLMFLAFGSVLLPIKAVLMSALSLSATFGILVWIFQDGHGADLLRVTPAPLEAGIVVLMAAVVFGLSTDYEVFLLSRMVEARTRGASTAEAVTTGLARTGRVISAAAVLLIVVTGAFALSSVSTMRFVGVGMIIALFLDATVVRMLLVPAVLRLMGDAAWWAPGPLRRLQERAGLAEYEDEELFPTVSVGRHAAPETNAAPKPALLPATGPGMPPPPAAGPGTAPVPVAGPGTVVAGPGTVVAGPGAVVAGPGAVVAGPGAVVAGPGAVVAGPGAVVAGPGAVVAGPSASLPAEDGKPVGEPAPWTAVVGLPVAGLPVAGSAPVPGPDRITLEEQLPGPFPPPAAPVSTPTQPAPAAPARTTASVPPAHPGADAGPSYGGAGRRPQNLGDFRPAADLSARAAPPPAGAAPPPAGAAAAPVNSATAPVNSATAPVNSATAPVNSATAPVNSATAPVNSAR
ncbi:MMPL family transporter, partial [Actinoplanes sp. NPDC049681]|uniref:MMPL family transporter n=1 Tax=Actinoplanes sp. NPDC049681 TaxID=3363905 RepID=UPI0037B231F3